MRIAPTQVKTSLYILGLFAWTLVCSVVKRISWNVGLLQARSTSTGAGASASAAPSSPPSSSSSARSPSLVRAHGLRS